MSIYEEYSDIVRFKIVREVYQPLEITVLLNDTLKSIIKVISTYHTLWLCDPLEGGIWDLACLFMVRTVNCWASFDNLSFTIKNSLTR